MTDQKDKDVDILVDGIKSKIFDYYKDYEECIDQQLEEFDAVIYKLTKLNENRLNEVDQAKNTVLEIIEDNSPLGSKIEKIKTKFQSIYTKMNDDYSTLLKLSNFDHLTNLFNRRQFDLHIEKACEDVKGFFLIMIDIDDFKLFNDNYGYIIGDQALKLVASIIKNVLK